MSWLTDIFKPSPSCNHEWETITDVVLPSAMEQLLTNVRTYKADGGNMPPWAFENTHVLYLKCVKCGKIYKNETRNPS